TLIQDRYLYFPSFGLCLLVADLAVQFARRGGWRVAGTGVGIGAAALVFAAILFHAERFWRDEAELFTRCIDSAPAVGIWHNRMGLALAARGDLSGAQREMLKAAALEPDDATNLYNLALIDERLGDRNAAANAIERWLKLLGKSAPSNAYAALALAADAAGDPNQSEAALKSAAALPGGAEAAALARAQIAFRHADGKGAEVQLREILRSDPDNGDALVTLGTLLAATNRDDEAVIVYRRAESLEPELPSLHYKLALVLHRMGRDPEARSEARKALAGAPQSEEFETLMAEIDNGDAK
ncbi:MAG TPA: tetratricopeptide repeat protein, partial [Candidatus Binataceae bacterium]|nr:tetratricopeptide repeat protein [Candidatus Binataceae bacterium]